MKFLLKIVLAPFMILLAIFTRIATKILTVSATIVSFVAALVLVFLAAVLYCFYGDYRKGIIGAVVAFVLSPWGLPMVGAWLIAQLLFFREVLKEKVYG